MMLGTHAFPVIGKQDSAAYGHSRLVLHELIEGCFQAIRGPSESLPVADCTVGVCVCIARDVLANERDG